MLGYDRILDELKNRGADQPDWAETLSLYVDLLSAQARVDTRRCETAALAAGASARLSQGLPILAPHDFRADPDVLKDLCDEICVITAGHRPELTAPLEAIRVWLRREDGSLSAFCADFLDEGRVGKGEETELDDSLLAYVFNNALHPFLRRYARVLAPLVDESIWYRPDCPICGGEPDFAALKKETGARRLLCSRCDFEWLFWRTTCPFCGCDDAETQKYSVTSDKQHRLYTCERCGRYLKTIDLREVAEERLLPVERILTLPMDVIARQNEHALLS